MICPLDAGWDAESVKPEQRVSSAEMERMVKLQDVLLKATAQKITWWAAAEIHIE